MYVSGDFFLEKVISITSLLNFSLAAVLAVLLGLPLTAARPAHSLVSSMMLYISYMALAMGWLMPGREVRQALWNWEVLGVWFAPFVCVVYAPLVLQAVIVILMPYGCVIT